MASLTGTKIKNTYDGLLKTTDNEPLDGTPRVITDGLGNATGLSLDTTGDVGVSGELGVSGATLLYSTLSVSGDAAFDTNVLYVDSINNRVGVGTFSPNSKFEISAYNDGTLNNALRITDSDITVSAGDPLGGIQFYSTDGAKVSSYIEAEYTSTIGDSDMVFATSTSGGAATEKMRINSTGASITGTLGVSGAATLSTSLEVVGNQFSENGDISLTNGDLNLTNGDLITGGKIVHLGDTNTYFNFPSADNIELVTGGTQRLLVSNTGASITGTLGVSGNVTFDTNVYVGGNVINVDDLDTSISFGTNNVNLITGGLTRLSASDASVQVTNPLVASSTLTVTGNYSSVNGDISLSNGKIAVGGSVSIANSIGAASFSPNANLLVLGDTGAAANQGMTIVSPTGSTGNIYFADGTTGDAEYRGSVTYNHNVDTLYLGAAAANKVAIDTNGASVTGTLAVSGNLTVDTNTLFVDAANNNVGIGTASPTNLAGYTTLSINNSSFGSIFEVMHNGTPQGRYFASGNSSVVLSAVTSIPLVFATNDTERMKIHSGGDISFRDSSANEAFYWDASAASLGIGGVPNVIANYSTLTTNGTNGSGLFCKVGGTNAGWFYSYADGSKISEQRALSIIIETSGTERMRIDSNGYVNCNANTALDNPPYSQGVSFGWNKSNGQGESMINFTNAGGGTAPSLTFNYWDNSTFSERMRIDSSGNVGIGNSSITAVGNYKVLELSGSSTNGGYLRLASSGVEQGNIYSNVGGLTISSIGATNQSFYTNGAERMRITSGGNLTLNASGGDTTVAVFEYSAGANCYVGIKSTSGTNYIGNVSNAMTFEAGGSERMRITSAGAVLQGYTAAIFGGFGNENFSGLHYSGGTSGGYVAINSDTSNAPLYISRTSSSPTGVVINFTSAGTGVGYITISGSATAYNTSSDYRLKEDLQPMEGALDRIDLLNPINFAWKLDGSRVDGFLAHELAEVVPEAVSGEKDATEIRSVEVSPAVYEDVIHPAEEAILDEEGNVIQEAKEEWVEKVLVSEAVFEEQEVPVYQGIDQSKIVPLLAAGLQEAHALIKELRAELNALKQA